MALNVSLDKTTYAPGDVMTLTVTTGPGDRESSKTVTGTVHVDGLIDATFNATVALPNKAVTVTDPANVWTVTSDDGNTAVYTATAPGS